MRDASSDLASAVEGMPVGAGMGVAKTAEERRRLLRRKRECILKLQLK